MTDFQKNPSSEVSRRKTEDWGRCYRQPIVSIEIASIRSKLINLIIKRHVKDFI